MISFDDDTSKGFETQKSAIKFLNQTFGAFIDRTQLNRKNICVFASLHKDTDHRHIHFAFFEKEPNHRYKDGTVDYTRRGKISQKAIDNYLVSANMHLSEHGEEYYSARDRALDRLNELRREGFGRRAQREVRAAVTALAAELPVKGRLQYRAKNMEEYRERIDRVADLIIQGLLPHSKDYDDAKLFTELNLRRKRNNLIARRIRMTRKANLQDFTHFVTLTYSNELHTEESFKKGLGDCLKNLSKRRGWKCMGVWERSPEKQRLHFHGIFYIPEGTMPGQMIDVNDYNFKSHRRRITHQNTYFNERFGRSDFEEIVDDEVLGDAMSYIMKYIEKSGERIVYYGDLPQFFVSDVMENDILCPYGEDGQKFILSDTFGCWDEGEYMGQVSKETIAKLPKVY